MVVFKSQNTLQKQNSFSYKLQSIIELNNHEQANIKLFDNNIWHLHPLSVDEI